MPMGLSLPREVHLVRVQAEEQLDAACCKGDELLYSIVGTFLCNRALSSGDTSQETTRRESVAVGCQRHSVGLKRRKPKHAPNCKISFSLKMIHPDSGLGCSQALLRNRALIVPFISSLLTMLKGVGARNGPRYSSSVKGRAPPLSLSRRRILRPNLNSLGMCAQFSVRNAPQSRDDSVICHAQARSSATRH